MRKGHATIEEVAQLRSRCRRARIKDGQVAAQVGVTRTYMNLLFNHRYPMRVKYLYSIESMLNS